MPMHLELQRGEVLAVCPNPAWQKTLCFAELRRDNVNRAESRQEFGGGKGVNVIRVLRNLGYPAALGTFLGGHNGELLAREIQAAGAELLCEAVEPETRTCITLLSRSDASATELIEPSGTIPETAVRRLQERLQAKMATAGAVCLSGSRPPGVPVSFYAELAREARRQNCPLLLDDVREIDAVLSTGGVTMLKINADELRKVTGTPAELSVPQAAALLCRRYQLPWLGVTDGAAQAWLFGGGRTWRYAIPRIAEVISAIGCGDCAAAILSMRLTTRPEPQEMPAYFAEALGCASASCRTAVPSCFRQEEVVLPTFEEI